MNAAAAVPPNTRAGYRNSDPLMVGWLIKQAVIKRGEPYLTFRSARCSIASG